MNRYLWPVVLLVAAAVVLLAPAAGSGSATPTYNWKFAPDINAPWAHEGDEGDFDTPGAAVGLCRSAPWSTPGAYAPTSDIDAIVGDPVNNSGSSNLGCRTPQNETTIAVDPGNPNHLVAGANDYRICCDFTGLNDATAWAYTSFNGGNTWTAIVSLTAK